MLYKKYSKELIIINSVDEDDEDETLVGFMSSRLTSEMDTFHDSLTSLMQRPLD